MTVQTSTYEMLRVERDGAAGIITINRPDKLNALNAQVTAELELAVNELDADRAVRAIIITGAGEKSFVAGADIAELTRLNGMGSLEAARAGQRLMRRIETTSKPVIAAINGFALGGGCELALACDIRLASENARLGLPEVGLGIIPGYGGTQRLPRIIGKGLALEMIVTGAQIKADEALRIGLVNKVVPQVELLDTAKAMVAQIAKNGPLAVAAARRVAHEGLEVDIDRGLAMEALHFSTLYSTRDTHEGLTAFVEKRKPTFTGE